MHEDRPEGNAFSAERYAKLAGFDSDWRDGWWSEDFLGLLASRWRLDRVARLLDVGSGGGHWGQRLARWLPDGSELVGVDREPGFLEGAAARAKERGLSRVTYVRGDAESLPFEDAVFGAVTCQTVLMHVANPAAALAEMRRVLKPGGLVVVSEPDNMANAMVEMSATPRPDWKTASALLGFQHVVEVGKQAQGQGDSSIGARMAGLVAEAGFEQVTACTNERCPALHPPYATRAQQVDLAQEIEWAESDVWPAAGHRDDAHRLFLAGGGAAEDFDGLWELQMTRQRTVRGAMKAGTYSAGRGFVQYVVWGRRRP
ncbi:MAG: class I SAM-dependent methyltransferase [Deltaproteobacteria bacterium]|nr:class I SAM-dependent methyltransferase [Deltaproteobacteria bacterium]